MSVKLVELGLADGAWRAFVERHPGATPFHHPAWASLLTETYGYRPRVLAGLDAGNRVVGGIPVLDVSRPLGGRRWVSLPFTDYCPLLADPGAEAELAKAIVRVAAARGINALEVRASVPPVERVHTAVKAVRHTLELAHDPQAVLQKISKHHRRNIRRAEQGELRIRSGASEADMAIFYRLHVLTRQRLGVPVQPWRFFNGLAQMLERDQLGFILIAELGQTPVAAAVFLAWRGVIVYKYGASDPAFWGHRPNNLLFWHAIRWGCEHGYTSLDWGRTDFDNAGLREFKTGWGAVEEPLAYSVIANQAPTAGSGRITRAMARVIRRSPPWVCRAMGEVLYRYAA